LLSFVGGRFTRLRPRLFARDIVFVVHKLERATTGDTPRP
jgi:hypothetical protein